MKIVKWYSVVVRQYDKLTQADHIDHIFIFKFSIMIEILVCTVCM